MEFTIHRRVRKNGLGLLWAGIAGTAGTVAWLIARGTGSGVVGPLLALGLSALALWDGRRELARLRDPFRLHIDAFGLTLHDAELSWAQVDAVALHYRQVASSDPPPRPALVLWPAAGVTLPRKPDRTHDGRVRYTMSARASRTVPACQGGPCG